ncbi:aromatic amino acid aminotransferase II [Hyphopichia burtonii NRRL Y-1933]|uniref:Aromatic amino acid aminotransferase II n=1 Tax=Hyphopichia burtonii NRRL Y-1933 TaxID=984485 RepID=A0A1E4RC54_9ASCO|nr:aromatic amino acid aminotransferase II [Hyphopichia burtonii NRRL Y-1933]ODV64816.1 aromatic amino acid aminotransferase II [Hyphopichia burtonii NRRL Y-1933]
MSHLLSERAAKRTVSSFISGDSVPPPEGYKPHPNTLPLHWGMPNEGFFPVDSIELNIIDYPFQKSLALPVTNASLESLQPTLSASLNESRLTNGHSATTLSVDDSLRKLKINKENSKVVISKYSDNKYIDLAHGLQYSENAGLPQLLKFTEDFIHRVHKPAYEEWSTIITSGAGDGLNKAAEVLLDDGDIILVEEFTFTPFLKNIEQAGGIAVPIKMDLSTEPDKSQGIDLGYLTDLLENWDERIPEYKGKKPKALYTIPTGQNPTGLTQTLEFRKKIYALAEKYDFAIIEDDPYGYLTLPPYQKPQGFVKLDELLTIDEYLKNHLTPSYVTIDTSGRVIRVETFSKLFAPGLRLGFVVAHKKFIKAIDNYAAVVTRQPSGLAQIVLQNTIEQKFGGVDGFINWFLKLRVSYIHRRNVLLNQIYESKAYKDKLIEVIDPRAGMFASLVINFPPGTNVYEKIFLLNWKFSHYGVGVVPGFNLAVDKGNKNVNFFRLTYAPSPNDDLIIEAANRLTNAVSDFFAKNLEF